VRADQVQQPVGLGRDDLQQAVESTTRVLLHAEFAQQLVIARLVRDDDRRRGRARASTTGIAGREALSGRIRGGHRHLRSPFRQAYSSPNMRMARKRPITIIPGTATARTVIAHRETKMISTSNDTNSSAYR